MRDSGPEPVIVQIRQSLRSSDDLESILWPTLRPGAYTTVLSGASNTTGVGIIELYEY